MSWAPRNTSLKWNKAWSRAKFLVLYDVVETKKFQLAFYKVKIAWQQK
jgi:hypothetical protein